MGIDFSRCIILEPNSAPIKFSHITVPEESYHAQYGYSEKYLIPYRQIISKLQNDLCNKTNRKIYFSCRKAAPKYYGEGYLEDFFRNQGFEIFYPETLPLKEQISLLINCEHFACIAGSLAHFVSFLPTKAKVSLFLRKNNQSNVAIYVQLKACGIEDYSVVDATYNLFYTGVYQRRPLLLGKTKHFCDYAKKEFNLDIKPELPLQYIDSYLKDSISDLINHFGRMSNWNSLDWLNQLHRGYYGGNLSPEISFSRKKMILTREMEKQNTGSHIEIFLDLHISNVGWISSIKATEKVSNPLINNIEALKISIIDNLTREERKFAYPLGFEYCTESNGIWGERKKAGEISGTTGKSTPITGFALYLDAETAEEYEIFYRIVDKNGKWSNWIHDGQPVSINAPVVDIAFMVKSRLDTAIIQK